MKLFLVLVCAAVAAGKTFVSDDFEGNWQSRWVASDWKSEEERGALVGVTGKHGDGKNHGVQTSEDARFYTYSTKHAKFDNLKSDLVIQFTVKHEQNLQCGGAYLKFHPSGLDQAHYHGGADEDKYNIMFGPDWCGTGHKRIHAIFNHKDKNHLLNAQTARAASDTLTHRYALVVSGKDIQIILDDDVVQTAGLHEPADYEILPAKKIPDPEVSKPADWVNDAEIPDTSDVKPAGWDEIPATIADPEASKPDDWDDELDGEWEAPMIPNPEYKGEWKQKRIPNPDYIGPWVHPQIENPDYVVPEDLGRYADFGVIGIEIWQVQAGTVFDNLLVTDSKAEADAAWAALADFRAAEKKAYEDEAAAKAAEDAAAAEAAAAAHGAEDGAEGDDDDHDEL